MTEHNEQQTGAHGFLTEAFFIDTRMALEYLRFLVKTSPWFEGKPYAHWFDVPAATLERLATAYKLQWSEVNWQTLYGTPLAIDDARFSSEHWAKYPNMQRIAAFYLLNAQFLRDLARSLPIDDEKSLNRLLFILEQAIAASAPSNFVGSNPDVWAAYEQSRGESLRNGLAYFVGDVQEGKLRQSSRHDFVVGADLATTAGAVIFENALFQLIQYQPRTTRQFKRPLLVVPPCINKYYILDLREHNSMVRHLLDEGHAVFLMSWRSADAAHAEFTWDDYIEDGVLKAMHVTREFTGAAKLNCMGFCIGGTLLATALAVHAARGGKDVASLTLLTTMLDFSDTGELDVFVDEEFVRMCEQGLNGEAGGPPQIMNGNVLANAFSLLRPDSLWWNVGIDKYLKGEKPRPLDLLFWNNDSTHLPGPMYCWYLRHTYLENDLTSGGLECCGEKVDFDKLRMPVYLFAAQSDHIVPWKTAYLNTQCLGGDIRFVLGASGHVAGVINPPAAKKRNYWRNDALAPTADAWLAHARSMDGSWWVDWFDWLRVYGGGSVAAPRALDNKAYPVIEAAPGRYVKG